MIAIIDYGLGNLKSVAKAFAYLGAEAAITSDPGEIASAPAVVLPGVGAFGRGMENLRRAGLDGAIREAVSKGTPLLGICLGLQLLFEASEEAPGIEGLRILGGVCRRFAGPPFETGELKSPHMGWNALTVVDGATVTRGVSSGDMAYFVHSYYAVPSDPTVVAARTTHGVDFCSVAEAGRVWACQFHPEKSARTGLTILGNFVRSIGYGDHSGS
jgi:glutamine amidotransferase